MNDSDFDDFGGEWLLAHEMSVSNQIPSDNAVNKAFEMLSDYPLQAVIHALTLHGQRCKFAPTPSAVIAILETGNKRLTADEAWALCPKDETETVVWTEEMAEAYGVCLELLQDGDKIGARMAFKSAYERLCEVAELQRQPVNWSVSVGHDKTKIDGVIKNAVSVGRLSIEQANKHLPAPMDGGVIGKLLTGKVVKMKDHKARQNVQRIKGIIESVKSKEVAKKKAEAEARAKKRIEFEAKRKAAVEYCESQGLIPEPKEEMK